MIFGKFVQWPLSDIGWTLYTGPLCTAGFDCTVFFARFSYTNIYVWIFRPNESQCSSNNCMIRLNNFFLLSWHLPWNLPYTRIVLFSSMKTPYQILHPIKSYAQKPIIMHHYRLDYDKITRQASWKKMAFKINNDLKVKTSVTLVVYWCKVIIY